MVALGSKHRTASSFFGGKGSARLSHLVFSAALAVSAFNAFLLTSWASRAEQPIHASPANMKQNAATVRGGRASGERYPFKVAICVLMKDAENYFEEWLDYNFAMGFDAIYIYDNSPSFELENWYGNTRNHSTFGKVEVVHWVDKTAQNQNHAYTDCVEKFGRSETGPKNDYFAFIDVDEFLVLRSPKYEDVRGVLADYLVPYGGALTVNWMMVGSSNNSVSSPLPITKRNQYRANLTHNVVKSFAKTSDYIKHINPHGVKVQSPANIHTTKFPGAPFKPSSAAFASDHERPSDILLLYHYRYGSKKEYVFKRCVRGDAVGGRMWCDGDDIRSDAKIPEHIPIAPGEVFDDTAWKFLTSRVPKYRVFDEFEDFHHSVGFPTRPSLEGED